MAKKNQNTFEKRRRDMEKKLRAEDKRKKKLQRKSEPSSVVSQDAQPSDAER
jgi:hypothetical protein